ncbi:MAG: U32 family peptidase [Lachnospiraceae bacterium]|nr:U32 family peptidase [Lachnospiraceae bacterium]
MKKPELLMPAGSFEILKTAFRFGADAVYVGGDMFSLRAKAHNFSLEELREAVKYTHSLNKKIYVTVNITAHNKDIDGIREYLSELEDIRPDAFIISDPGVIMLAKKYAPSVEIHISTQANNVNYLTFLFWQQQGAKRIVTGRELSISEIKEIRENIPDDLEIESFIHGAMCISYSGRCLLSNYFTGRDANLGECTHPCRWKYYISEETRPGEFFPIEENDRGTYIFNSKDLCMIDHIPELIDAGIDSFKIEGRMKTALYAATIARAYRIAIDTFFESGNKYKRNREKYLKEISKCTNRMFTTGFYFGKPGQDSMVFGESTYVKDYVYLGTLESVERFKYNDGKNIGAKCELIQKNKFCVGDEIEILSPGNLKERFCRVLRITDTDGKDMPSCPHASQRIIVYLDVLPKAGDLLRRGPVNGG